MCYFSNILENFVIYIDFFFFLRFIYLFHFWLCWISIDAHGLSPVVAWWLLLLLSMGLRHTGSSSCGAQT